ncbi:unnamed protein product [Urochloa humidicola]
MTKHDCELDEVTLRGRFDCGKARAHYVFMDLSSESEWKQYKEVVASANVVCYKVVVELRLRAHRSVKNADGDESAHIRAENLSRECNPSQVLDEAPTVNNHNQQPDDSSLFDSFRLVVDFDPEVFEQEEEVDDDDISLGSEGEEDDSDGHEEDVEINEGPGNEDVGGHFDETEEYGSPIAEAGQPTVHRHEDNRLPYTARENALMKEVDVEISVVPNDKDISMVRQRSKLAYRAKRLARQATLPRRPLGEPCVHRAADHSCRAYLAGAAGVLCRPVRPIYSVIHWGDVLQTVTGAATTTAAPSPLARQRCSAAPSSSARQS